MQIDLARFLCLKRNQAVEKVLASIGNRREIRYWAKKNIPSGAWSIFSGFAPRRSSLLRYWLSTGLADGNAFTNESLWLHQIMARPRKHVCSGFSDTQVLGDRSLLSRHIPDRKNERYAYRFYFSCILIWQDRHCTVFYLINKQTSPCFSCVTTMAKGIPGDRYIDCLQYHSENLRRDRNHSAC